MSLGVSEWRMRFELVRLGLAYQFDQGDDADTSDPVQVLADGFSMHWAFEEEVSPGPLEPETLTFKLSCVNAAAVPAIEKGDLVMVRLWALNALDAPTGQVAVGYRVTDLVAVDEDGRMVLTVTASTAPGTLDQRIDVKGYITAAGQTTWLAYSDANNAIPRPEGWFALAQLLPTLGPEWHYASFFPSVGPFSYRGAGLKLPDSTSASELIAAAHELWFAPAGDHGYGSGLAAVAVVQPQFSVPDGEYTIVASAGWDPEGYAPQAAPMILTYVAGVLDVEVQPDWTVRGNSSASVMFLDARYILASPEWRKAASTRITAVQYEGLRRTSADPTTDADMSSLARVAGVPAATDSLRTIETSGYLVNSLDPTTGFTTYGGKPAADAMILGSDDGGWAPEEFTILPKRMDLDEWLQLTLEAFWPSSGDLLKIQRTIVIFNIEDDTNMAAGPVWLTMIGCDLTMSRGRLEITPVCRPYVPSRINGITDAVTWAQVKATYPTATWAQSDAVTWAAAGISTI